MPYRLLVIAMLPSFLLPPGQSFAHGPERGGEHSSRPHLHLGHRAATGDDNDDGEAPSLTLGSDDHDDDAVYMPARLIAEAGTGIDQPISASLAALVLTSVPDCCFHEPKRFSSHRPQPPPGGECPLYLRKLTLLV